jgi:hypothetical protein
LARISAISKYAVLNVGVLKKVLSDIADSTKNFEALPPTALKKRHFYNLSSAYIFLAMSAAAFRFF